MVTFEFAINNETVTSSGSFLHEHGTSHESIIFWNIQGPITGSSPTIQFSIKEIDPSDRTTVIGQTETSSIINTTGAGQLVLSLGISPLVSVTWTVGGISPSFGGTSLAVMGREIGNTININTSSGSYGGQIEGRAADGYTPVGNPVLVAGYDGTNVQNILTDSLGRVIIAPAGTSSSTSGFVMGYATLSATSIAAVNATTYTEQTVNFTGSIKSSSASDTSAGTGARTITITYYDQTGAGPFTETVTLNGTTAVNLSNTNHCFIEKIAVATVGSNASNVGTISLFTGAAGTGTTVGTIAIGDNRTFWSHHYTPVGKTTYITSISVGGNTTSISNGCTFFARSITIGTANAVEVQISDFIENTGTSNSIIRTYGTPIVIIGPARTRVYAQPYATHADTRRSAFDFYDQ